MDGSVDFNRFDKILEGVQLIFEDIMKTYGIDGGRIERWHRDEPRITLTWLGNDGIGRNMSSSVNDKNGQPSDLELEISAWVDRDEQEGRLRMRKWRHELVSRSPLPLDSLSQELREACEKAFHLVSGWSLGDLKNDTPIASTATA